MISLRLKEERIRLGQTQESFAEVAGAKRRTLIDWEKGVSSPTAVQLSALSTIGVDVQYVVTGRRHQGGIGESSVHQAVLDAVDLLSLDQKVDAAQLAKAVVKLIAKSAQEITPVAGQVISTNSGDGTQQNVIGSNVDNLTQIGTVTTGPGVQQSFHAPVGQVAGRDVIINKKKP